jgi:hypothetical protein
MYSRSLHSPSMPVLNTRQVGTTTSTAAVQNTIVPPVYALARRARLGSGGEVVGMQLLLQTIKEGTRAGASSYSCSASEYDDIGGAHLQQSYTMK